MMNRVLIVDDEFASRETLKCIIDWGLVGFDEPTCVSSGKQALAEIEKQPFDVVITDIEMPRMNGLELIKMLKEINPLQRIIIISCHEKFDYARAAIRLGIEDYFIKDLLTPEELYLMMMNMMSDTGQGAQELPGVPPLPQLPVFAQSEAGKRPQADKNQSTIAMMIVVDSYAKHKASKGTYQWLSMIEAFLQELRGNGMPEVSVRAGNFLVTAQIENSYSTLHVLNSMVQQANFIRLLSKKVGISSVSIGISNPGKSFQEISKLYDQAAKACSMRVLLGLNRNIAYNTIANKVKIFDKEILEQKIKRIKQLLYARDEQCLPLVASLYNINLMDGFMEINYFRYLNNRLFSLAQGYAEQFETVMTDAGLNFETLEALETVHEMQAFFSQIFQYLLNSESQEDDDTGSLVERTQKYVQKNFEKDISLVDIAGKMGVHKGYLSRVFKEQTGENLMQYIVEKKIERAKVLLEDTQMKLSDIAKALGFTTPQYFCIVFKKNTELTPQEYRNGQKIVDGE